MHFQSSHSTGGFKGGGAHSPPPPPKIAKAKFFDMIFSSRYCFWLLIFFFQFLKCLIFFLLALSPTISFGSVFWMTSTGVLCFMYVLMLTSVAIFIIQTTIVAPDQSSLMWVRNVCNKYVKWSSRLYRANASKKSAYMPMLMDRNACVIPIINVKKHPNYATQKSKQLKAFFEL